MAHPLLLLDVLVGLGLLAVIAIAAKRPPASTSSATRLVGWALVAVPLPLTVALHLLLPLPVLLGQAAFVGGVVAFAVGAVLVLRADDRGDQSPSSDDLEPPPWWPEFERDFRAYARERPRAPLLR